MNITNIEMAQATMEGFAGLVCLIMAIVIILNGQRRQSWKCLKWMFFTTAVIFFAESCAYIFRGNTQTFSLYMTRVGNFTVFLCNLILMRLYIDCMYGIFEERNLIPNPIYRKLVRDCVDINFIILLLNPWTHWMYSFDSSNYYHRNAGWYLYTVIILVCIVIALVLMMHCNKVLNISLMAALLFYAVVPILALALQMLIYGFSFTNMGVFAALMAMLLAYLREWNETKEIAQKNRKAVEVIFLFCVMTICMSASIVSCIVSLERVSSENSKTNSMLLAQMVSDELENEFLRPVIVSETMSSDLFLKEYLRQSGEQSAEKVEQDMSTYLSSIRMKFGYEMVFAVCNKSKAFYTYNGISKYVDVENDEHDVWYSNFLKKTASSELNVDEDEANQKTLSVFVNQKVIDSDGNFLGVCGVGIEMTRLQELLQKIEEEYHVKIDLIDRQGLIQVDSDVDKIGRDYIDNDYLRNVGSREFYYEPNEDSSRMTKYMKALGWYLVVEDCNPDKLDVLQMVFISICIFVLGLIVMAIVFFVITIREGKAYEELMEKKRISITDDITGLLNRHAYEDDCKKLMEEAAISELTIIMMDLNGLKETNDTRGHLAGDELIIGAAKCIQTAMGEYGKAYRIGGDEFVAVIKCDAKEREDMLGTFTYLVDSWRGMAGNQLSISKGIVVCAECEDMTFEDMKQLADQRMYEDKMAYYKRTGKQRRK